MPNIANFFAGKLDELVIREDCCGTASHRQGGLIDNDSLPIEQFHHEWMEWLASQVFPQRFFEEFLIHEGYSSGAVSESSSESDAPD